MDKRSIFNPDERLIRFNQTWRDGVFSSKFTYPSTDHYPKNFNTKISKKEAGKLQEVALCPITGKPAKYRDPLTQ